MVVARSPIFISRGGLPAMMLRTFVRFLFFTGARVWAVARARDSSWECEATEHGPDRD